MLIASLINSLSKNGTRASRPHADVALLARRQSYWCRALIYSVTIMSGYLNLPFFWTFLSYSPFDMSHGGAPLCWGPCGSRGTLRKSHRNPHRRLPSWPQVTWSCVTSGTLACLPWSLSHHMFRCDKSHPQLHQCRPAMLCAISTNSLVWSTYEACGCSCLLPEQWSRTHDAGCPGNWLPPLQLSDQVTPA